MPLATYAKRRLRQLTPEFIEEAAGYFRAGMTPKMAAGKLGIPPRVLKDWLSEGEREVSEMYLTHDGKGTPTMLGTLYLDCAKSTAEALEGDLLDVKTANGQSSQWRARAWLLERGDEDLNPASRVEVTGRDGGPLVVEGKAVVGLADVISLYRELGKGHLLGLGPGDAQPALSAADEVLPDPPDDEPPASGAARLPRP